MPFNKHYANLVAEQPQAHTRLIRDYDGSNSDFDFSSRPLTSNLDRLLPPIFVAHGREIVHHMFHTIR